MRCYRATPRKRRPLRSIGHSTRSPRHAHFKELVSGLDVIHGFEREPFFMARFYAIPEHYQRMHHSSSAAAPGLSARRAQTATQWRARRMSLYMCASASAGTPAE
jgi:hypothetical protein